MPLLYDTQGTLAAGGVITTFANSRLLGCNGLNTSAGNLYLMFFDATSVPANGAVPKFTPWLIIGNSTFTFALSAVRRSTPVDQWEYGRLFVRGIVWAISSTPQTLTQATAVLLLAVDYDTGQRLVA
jgi:hypothetical protein